MKTRSYFIGQCDNKTIFPKQGARYAEYQVAEYFNFVRPSNKIPRASCQDTMLNFPNIIKHGKGQKRHLTYDRVTIDTLAGEEEKRDARHVHVGDLIRIHFFVVFL